MRLNKFISESGICSRREADELIDAGRVRLNGEVAEKGAKWLEGMVGLVDDKEIKTKVVPKNKRRHVYIGLYKPVGTKLPTQETVKSQLVTFCKP